MDLQPVKGTRDFYPEAMRVRNWIADAWRRVSLRSGFEEYDSPILESLDLFEAKSGPEIAEQLFSFTDRGGRRLAIRPETTPALARMVNAKVNSLPRPIKWFSISRLCRAENPQKGRLREFFQWNIDILGEPSPQADAECVLVAVDALRELGLTAAEVKVRYASRALVTAVLGAAAVGQEQIPKVLSVLDKRDRVPAGAFEAMLRQAVSQDAARQMILRFMDTKEPDAAAVSADLGGELSGGAAADVEAAIDDLRQFRSALGSFGIADWCRYDPGVVRGLAYYTGIVYEVFDATQSLRAVAGGGRYDNLLEVLGGPTLPGTGFGMGDVVLGILLEEKGKLPSEKKFPGQRLDFFVIDADGSSAEQVLSVVAALRRGGLAADFSYKRQPLGKQLKEANRRAALRAAICRGATVTVKDLTSGEQVDRPLEDFLAKPLG
ncbi:MAG: histidine--tRNA ligase [Phycisphaerae bacterium]|nr:histidine--tRNA ligase [Phycisphaerae bacterium]